mmetsp:Transcript_34539/g.111233  ORF Transcript_34539/g.111233 Transcript_34539/m.111233 type:complete len:320 (-) Transcript_34539:404-1363(-)
MGNSNATTTASARPRRAYSTHAWTSHAATTARSAAVPSRKERGEAPTRAANTKNAPRSALERSRSTKGGSASTGRSAVIGCCSQVRTTKPAQSSQAAARRRPHHQRFALAAMSATSATSSCCTRPKLTTGRGIGTSSCEALGGGGSSGVCVASPRSESQAAASDATSAARATSTITSRGRRPGEGAPRRFREASRGEVATRDSSEKVPRRFRPRANSSAWEERNGGSAALAPNEGSGPAGGEGGAEGARPRKAAMFSADSRSSRSARRSSRSSTSCAARPAASGDGCAAAGSAAGSAAGAAAAAEAGSREGAIVTAIGG